MLNVAVILLRLLMLRDPAQLQMILEVPYGQFWRIMHACDVHPKL